MAAFKKERGMVYMFAIPHSRSRGIGRMKALGWEVMGELPKPRRAQRGGRVIMQRKKASGG